MTQTHHSPRGLLHPPLRLHRPSQPHPHLASASARRRRPPRMGPLRCCQTGDGNCNSDARSAARRVQQRATWPPALVASPSTQHAVRNDQSLTREALLAALDARYALLRGSLASMYCHSHQALTSVTSPFCQRPNLFMLHPVRPPRVQRTVASATTLRERTCHHISFGDPNTCVPPRPRAV